MQSGFVGLLTGALVAATPSFAEGEWSIGAFGGQMTSNDWIRIFDPASLDWENSYLYGLTLSYERPRADSRFTWGAELQLVQHTGLQDHNEINFPVTLRYTPDDSWFGVFDSFSYGIGLSLASDKPEIELNRKEDTAELLIYWMAELEFDTPLEQQDVFVRLHHRSDGYGLMEVDNGSNGIVFGFRQRF